MASTLHTIMRGGRAALLSLPVLTIAGGGARGAPHAPTQREGNAARGDFDPRALAPDSDAHTRTAQALWLASQGDLPAALRALEPLAAAREAPDTEPDSEPDSEPGAGADTQAGGDAERAAARARAQREGQRLGALLAAREAALAELVSQGGRWSLELDGKKLAVKVESYAAGVLRLAKNRAEVEAVSVDAVRPGDLMAQIKRWPQGSPGWLDAYVLWLAGDERWSKRERDAALAGDLETPALSEWLRAGRTAFDLERLSATVLDGRGQVAPEAAADVEARLRRLAAEERDDPAVTARLSGLAGLAERCARAAFDAEPGRVPLAGQGTRDADGVVRLHYEFEAPAEARDFELDTGYLSDWHQSMKPVPKDAADSYFIVKQGAFFGDGQLVYRHRLAFRGEVRAAYRMRYVPREGDGDDVGVFMIGLADDGHAGFAAASEFGDVYVTDPGAYKSERALFDGERVLGINKIYSAEARLVAVAGGFEVQAWREGELRNRLPAGTRGTGGVFLFAHTPRIVAIESLDIVGVPEEASWTALREAWVADRRVEMGY